MEHRAINNLQTLVNRPSFKGILASQLIGLILWGSILARPVSATSEAWFELASGSCSAPTLVSQITAGETVLLLSGNLMPGAPMNFQISPYGQTSRSNSWSINQTVYADVDGNICVEAFVTAIDDYGGFVVLVYSLDADQRQYNPPAKLITILPAPTPTPTNSPTPPPTDTDVPTAISLPTSTPTLTSTLPPASTPVATDAPTATPVPSQTPTSTPVTTDTPTATPVPSQTPTSTPVATDTPTATLVPSQTPTSIPVVTDAPTSIPTNTPEPTLIPLSTNTPVITLPPTDKPAVLPILASATLSNEVVNALPTPTFTITSVPVVQTLVLSQTVKQSVEATVTSESVANVAKFIPVTGLEDTPRVPSSVQDPSNSNQIRWPSIIVLLGGLVWFASRRRKAPAQ